MSNTNMIVVVAGARGNLGKLVCDALIARAKQQGRPILIRGLVRNDSSRDASVTQKGALNGQPEDSQIITGAVDYASIDDLRRVCKGAHAVVSTLQGVDDAIIGVQSRLFEAAIAENVRRFIPSDFAIDFFKLPAGTNRNFDIRLGFHKIADDIIRRTKSNIELTSIFQGAFTELLGTGWMLFNYKKRQVQFFGSSDTVMDFTTWKNTAEFTAAVVMDANSTPRSLHISGHRLTPKDMAIVAKRATEANFKLRRVMPIWMLRAMISMLKFLKPGKKDDAMPMWVGLQYAHSLALGLGSNVPLDNDKYSGIAWTEIDNVVRRAFDAGVNETGYSPGP